MAKDVTSASGADQTKKESGESKDSRDKKKVTNDNIDVGNFEQLILNENIDKAVNYFQANPSYFNYRTFRQVNGPSATIVNKLRGIENLDVFYGIKSSTLSLLRPKIRIYKVTYEDYSSEDGQIDPASITALRTPCYREIKFSDNFGRETAATVQDYLAYESTRPHWRNVGLKSFTINQDGETHGIIENNIDCSLELTFKSLKDLQASPPGEPPPDKGGVRYVDLIMWSPAKIDRETDTYNPKHYEIKVLLGYTAPSRQELQNLNLSPRDIAAISNIEKLNSVVSLSLYNYDLNIKDDGQVILKGQYRGRIETAIGTNQVNIFQNTFTITKNGAVDISRKVNKEHNISNVYRLRTMLNTIQKGLRSAGCKDDKCKARTNLKSIVDKDNFFAVAFKEAFAKGNKAPKETGIMINSKGNLKVIGDGTAMYAFFKETKNISKIQAVIKKKVGLYKKDVYKTFVDQLIDGNTDAPNAPGTRLFCISAGEEEIQSALGVIVEDTAATPAIEASDIDEETTSKSQTSAIPKGKVGVKVDRCHLVDPIDPEIKNSVASDIASSISKESESKDKKKSEPHKDPARASIKDFTGKKYKFYYVYLGDIIELACKNAGLGKLDLKSNRLFKNEGFSVFSEQTYFPDDKETSRDYPLKNARILLGPMEYIDKNGDLQQINLAQFPISFNYFRSWFLKKVVRRRRSQMPLGGFISSLINSLVMPALGAGMPKNYRAPSTRSNLVSLTLPGKLTKSGGTERKTCGNSLGNYEEALPKTQVIDVASAEFREGYLSFATQPISSETLIKTSYDYLLVHVSSAKNIIERRGDPNEDLKDGIYHFNIGSDMGLLKNMSFERVNLPMLAELRSKQAEEQGVDSLEQLKFPYDTNLTLIGTSLFMPGMFYYVNPSLAGLGSIEDARSLAYKMNLGGYHLIGKISTTITADSYVTKVDGTQTAQGAR